MVLFPPLHVGHALGFAPEPALEDLGLPLWGPGVEMVQMFGLQGFWQHQVLSGGWRLGQQKYSALEGYGGEGNGNPLQYSCLENPMDGGAW